MTKRIFFCVICDANLGNLHGSEERVVVSNHILVAHPSKAIELAEIGLQLEELQARFREISGMPSRESLHAFINQNALRQLGFSEERIAETLKRD